jgi:hypothetical protein
LLLIVCLGDVFVILDLNLEFTIHIKQSAKTNNRKTNAKHIK